MSVDVPAKDKNAFTCPHCEVRSQQEWSNSVLIAPSGTPNQYFVRHWPAPALYMISACLVCRRFAFWENTNLVWPAACLAPICSSDCPEPVKTIYEEARRVYSSSPRASAALLRLSIQMLCNELVSDQLDLNKAIGYLVERGLPKKVQQALDVVRVIGNNAVHPGTINIIDDPTIALRLFTLVNMIVDSVITQPRQIDDMFGTLPTGALLQIEKRDS